MKTSQEEISAHKIKHNVAEILVKVTTTSQVWRDILSKDTTVFVASMKGQLSCEPGIRQLGIFMGYFDFSSK